MKLFCFAVVLAFLPQDPAPEAWFPWHGFSVGSRIVVRKSDIGGAEAPVKMYRQSVTAIENGWPKVDIEFKEGDAKEWDKLGTEPVPYAGKSAAAMGLTEKELPKGEMTIDGRKVAVTVSAWTKDTFTLTVTRAAGLKLPLRQAPGHTGNVTLPPDTVAWKVSGNSMNLEMHVVSTDRKLKIGDREVSCLYEEGTSTMRMGDADIKGKTKSWSSDSIPGRKVRTEVENDAQGKISGSITEIIEFETKPAK